tara:strand:- start:2201 stop:2428 length:228 start_codon:yes stop_codon:yes gene_type:complete
MKSKTKKTKNKSKQTMGAVKTMVEFMKDEVDRAILGLSTQEKISKENVESVSNVIKMSIDSAFIKTAGMVQDSVE